MQVYDKVHIHTSNLEKDANREFEMDGSQARFNTPTSLGCLQSSNKCEWVASDKASAPRFISVPVTPQWFSSSARLRSEQPRCLSLNPE